MKRINRIEYITHGNPKGVAELLQQAGYEPPRTKSELAEAAKEWVRLEGKHAVKQLLSVHPERMAILEANEHEDGFCGCEHAYSGCGCHDSFDGDLSELDIKDELSRLTYDELLDRFDELRELVDLNPDDDDLQAELHLTSDAIDQQDEEEPDHHPVPTPSHRSSSKKQDDILFNLTKKDLAFGGAVIAIAFLVSRI